MDPFDIRYLRPVKPVAFPPSDPEWDMSEGTRHARLCEILARILRQAVGLESTVGADQMVYFDASDPKRKCAPDAFVKLGVPQDDFPSWKTWKGGVPEICVEVLSSDGEEKLSLKEKLRRFHTMGVSEVFVFNADKPKGKRLRAWDWIEGDLVERVVEHDRTPCRTLGKWFVVAPCPEERESDALRLSDDAEGTALVPTLKELAQIEAERERRARERAQAEKVLAEVEAERERAEKERVQAEKERALAELAELRKRLEEATSPSRKA